MCDAVVSLKLGLGIKRLTTNIASKPGMGRPIMLLHILLGIENCATFFTLVFILSHTFFSSKDILVCPTGMKGH
jgi:hypothetical protein